MKKCMILIPLYKYDLYDYEILSINRILDLYSNHDFYKIYFLIPDNFDFNKFLTNNNLLDKIYNYSYICYPDYFFTSTITYNKIMLSPNLWEIIKEEEFEYVLLYQLDAYIFNDELSYWINKGYDYIGSYEGLFNIDFINQVKNNIVLCDNDKVDNYKLIRMNGGFSLRKVDYLYDLLSNEKLKPFVIAAYQTPDAIIEEDTFYSIYTSTLCRPLDAIKFGYSHHYVYLSYSINDFKYPFGCHAINKSKMLMDLIYKFNEENNLNYL